MHKSILVILEIIKKEFYQVRQDKRMMMVSVVAPIMQVLLLGYAATTDIKNSNLVVCDLDRTAESRSFIKEFTNSNYFTEKYIVDVPDGADYYIEHARASIALVIAPGFGRKQVRHESAQVQVILDGTDA